MSVLRLLVTVEIDRRITPRDVCDRIAYALKFREGLRHLGTVEALPPPCPPGAPAPQESA